MAFAVGLLAGLLSGLFGIGGGIVPLATGLMGFCPLYRLVGINTCRVPARDAHAKI